MSSVLPWHSAFFRELLAQLERLPHALLLHGAEGTGKSQFALALSQVLLCEAPTDTGACGICASCAWLNGGMHPDFRRIEPVPKEGDKNEGRAADELQITIDQIRDLAGFLMLSTHRGGRRVIVLRPAERLNTNAANALLKSLEEPPPNTHFILVAHRPHYLLPTIKSRCRLVAMPSPTRQVAAEWLKSQGLKNAALAAAHTGDAPLLALALSPETYWEPRLRFLDRLCDARFDAMSAADEFEQYPISYVLRWLQKWAYDLALQKGAGEVRYNPDRAKFLAAISRPLTTLAILGFCRSMVHLERSVRHPLNARLFMEDAFIAYAELVRPALINS